MSVSVKQIHVSCNSVMIFASLVTSEKNAKSIWIIRSYDLLPNYIKAFTACIIPFRIYKLTEAVNPTKLFEYLAAGKSVISTALPELAIYKHAIYVASTYNEFLESIDNALSERKHDSAELLAIASKHDWQDKVRQILHIIELYKGKQTTSR